MNAQASDWEILFETSPCFGFKAYSQPYAGHQAGGRMAISNDDKLYLTVGDYEFDGHNVDNFPQDPSSAYGKVWRIDLVTGEADMFSLGHRNSQGIAITPNGEIWATEHGPEGGDELNYLVEGENYGWPYAIYGTNYGERTWPLARRQGVHEGYKKPAWAWVPSIGVSSVQYVDGFHPIWNGNLLAGSLADMSLYRIVTHGEHVVTFERIEIGERVRDVLVHSGRVFVYTDAGNVLRLSPRAPQDDERLRELAAGLSTQATGELNRCLECHGRNQSGSAPNLCGVLGRPVAGSDYDGYSPALASFGGRWSKELLMEFLRDADGTLPGTTMPDPQIADPNVRNEIVNDLDFFCG